MTTSYKASNKCGQCSSVLVSVASVQARTGLEYRPTLKAVIAGLYTGVFTKMAQAVGVLPGRWQEVKTMRGVGTVCKESLAQLLL